MWVGSPSRSRYRQRTTFEQRQRSGRSRSVVNVTIRGRVLASSDVAADGHDRARKGTRRGQGRAPEQSVRGLLSGVRPPRSGRARASAIDPTRTWRGPSSSVVASAEQVLLPNIDAVLPNKAQHGDIWLAQAFGAPSRTAGTRWTRPRPGREHPASSQRWLPISISIRWSTLLHKQY
jgi:hypothetical protein